MNKMENIADNKTVSGGFKFDFISKKKILLIISAVIIAVGVISFIVRGFNWDIDFVGGTLLHYRIGTDLDAGDQSDIRTLVEDVIGQSVSVVVAGSAKDEVIIKTLELNTNQREDVFTALSEKYGIVKDDILEAESVSPSVGKDLTEKTIYSVLVAVVLMLVYITIRFDFFSGAAAVVCLIHDVFVMLTFYSLLQIPMNSSVIAAVLTILGYSINATIIIFDRVRENVKLNKQSSAGFGGIVNKSVNQTLLRSINTTVTTVLTITVVYVLGVESIREFVLPLIIGMVAGLYSSVCLAGTVWDTFKNLKENRAAKKND